jgi:hypothetical protein
VKFGKMVKKIPVRDNITVVLENIDNHQAIELASFAGGFLATNEGKACITEHLQSLYIQIMDELNENDRKEIEGQIKTLIENKEKIKGIEIKKGFVEIRKALNQKNNYILPGQKEINFSKSKKKKK